MNMNKTPVLNLYKIKEKTKISSIKVKLLEIHRNPHHKRIFYNQLFPSSTVSPPFLFRNQKSSIAFEMEWLIQWISFYKNSIQEFLHLKDMYTLSYFKSEFDECKHILDSIETKFGLSIWLIESKINLFKKIDESFQLSEQYIDDLINSKANIYYKIFGYILFMKSDNMVSPARFEIELDRIINNWGLINYYELSDYINFKFSLSVNPESLDLLALLKIQENLSIIDRFYTLVNLIECSIDTSNIALNSKVIDKSISTINNISQSQLTPYFKIKSLTTLKFQDDERFSLLTNALDQYSAGNYDQTISICESILEDSPFEVEIYEIYLKSLLTKDINHIPNEIGVFYKEILRLILDYYREGEENSESLINTLIKICSDHISNEWAWKLLSSCTTLKFGNNILESISSFKKGYKLSHFIKPQVLSYLFNESIERDKYISYTFPANSITRKVHEAYNSLNIELINTLDIDENRNLRLQGNLYLIKQKYSHALSCFNKIDNKNAQIYESEINIGKVKSYIALNELELAIDIIVNSYFSGNNLLLEVDVEPLYANLLNDEYDNSNINVLVFIELFSKFISSNLPIKKHDFLEEFLFSNQISLISELDFNSAKYDNQKLIYVLREYCTVDNMAKYFYFESQKQVEEERIQICIILTEIDPINIEIYNDEIKEITQKIQIREYSAALEKSKIYVDIDGIKKQASQKIEENFNRIVEYFNSARNKGEPIIFTFDRNSEDTLNTIKGNRYSDIYNELVNQVRDTFISSKEYGLDVYLSLGIRHGTIFGQLRKMFEKDNFLTLFVSSKNRYKRNDFWLSKMNVTSPDTKEKIDDAFQKFNNNIDKLLLNLKDETLQISTDINSLALFNYNIPPIELLVMFSKDSADKNLNLDSFINTTIDKLWNITEANLLKVRSYLKNEFRELLLTEINDFISSIEKINFEKNNLLHLSEFDQKTIDLKTDLEYQIEKVSDWFTKEKVIEIDNFPIDLPINIALEFIKSINVNADFNPQFKFETDLQIDGKYLKWFSELFITIFDNILKRSGFRTSFTINLKSYLNENNQLIISCTNPLDLPEEEITARKKLLTEKAKEIELITNHEESDLISRASKEGGSGLYKIVKLLKYDIKSDLPKLDFGITDDNCFYIEIKLNTRGFAVANPNS
ncbi:hypothetical protein [Domibacillus indicus]|uniref:hypothetical protein n=1 Tax=Domibacillus indicus TaxID=1437523 RepID=UPI000617B76C|nr:hypothetical protein [Domibacillus indicus]